MIIFKFLRTGLPITGDPVLFQKHAEGVVISAF